VSTANTTVLAHRVAEIVLGPALSPVVRTSAAASVAVRSDTLRAITPAQRAAFGGRWYSEELDVTWEIVDGARGEVQLRVPRRDARTLRALGDDTLAAGELQLVRESPTVLVVHAGRVRGVRFVRAR
jgi:hypothetical protein